MIYILLGVPQQFQTQHSLDRRGEPNHQRTLYHQHHAVIYLCDFSTPLTLQRNSVITQTLCHPVAESGPEAARYSSFRFFSVFPLRRYGAVLVSTIGLSHSS